MQVSYQLSFRQVYRCSSLDELVPAKKQYRFFCTLLQNNELHLLSECLIKTNLLYSKSIAFDYESEVVDKPRQTGGKIRSFAAKNFTNANWWDVLLYHFLGKKTALLIGNHKHLTTGSHTVEVYPVCREVWNAFMQVAPRSFSSQMCRALDRLCIMPSNKEFVTLIRQKIEPVILPSGWIRHSITVVFFGSYLFLCNRGDMVASFTSKNITVFHVNTNRVRRRILQKILSWEAEDKEIRGKFLFKTLPAQLQGEKDDFCNLIEEKFQPKDQENANCVVANLKQAMRVVLLCQARLCNMKSMEQLYQEFAEFSRLYILQAFALHRDTHLEW